MKCPVFFISVFKKAWNFFILYVLEMSSFLYPLLLYLKLLGLHEIEEQSVKVVSDNVKNEVSSEC